ncbi:hypothetical protein Patl_3497 [Paraglaciecola sp. T6c]|uniref:hypothetical protein n=1 Tax=Pseudoalteromonas atlantica (strain T6c / ATCC BAA-1087) TaxID=3042615 RepID=UPI0000DA6E68|nr:hypothetical protein [Paraglaciecola sp. T6c]ABG41999.1 hypothetical protein Patl_3497 [Paraglaciecola sp. T6c]
MSWTLAQVGTYTLATPQGMPLLLCVVLGVVLITAWLTSSVLMLRGSLSFNSQAARASAPMAIALVCINTLAFAALLATVLDIKNSTTHIERAVLVTKGTTPEMLATFENHIQLHSNGKYTQRWFDLKSELQLDDAQHIPSPSLLAHAIGDMTELVVLGDGLSPAQWQTLFLATDNWGTPENSKVGVTFMPSAETLGIVNISWQKQLQIGQALHIRGALSGESDSEENEDDEAPSGVKSYILQLVSPSGEVEQEISLRRGEAFSLVTHPKAAGQWRYPLRLRDKSSNALLEENDIALSVSQNDSLSAPLSSAQINTALRTAIWQSAPSFETKHLKEWISASGNAVNVTTQISQDAYLRQYINQPTPDASTVTPIQQDDHFYPAKTLAGIDILFMDGRGLNNLSKDQTLRLQQAVEGGLGLFLFADSNLVSEDTRDLTKRLNLPVLREDKQAADEFTIVYPKQFVLRAAQALPAPTDLTLRVGAFRFDDEEAETLLVAPNGRSLVKRHSQGLGQVAITLLPRTYEWKLNQTNGEYERLWHYLIEHIARNSSANYWLNEPTSGPVFERSHGDACLRIASKNHNFEVSMDYVQRPSNELEQQPLILNQRPEQPNIACAHYWPESSGWHRISASTPQNSQPNSTKITRGVSNAITAQQYRYVYSLDSWLAAQQAAKHWASHGVADAPAKTNLRPLNVTLNKGAPFAMLVLLLSALWLIRRLR